MSSFNELIEWSQTEKRGLTIFIKGQTVAGVTSFLVLTGDQARSDRMDIGRNGY